MLIWTSLYVDLDVVLNLGGEVATDFWISLKQILGYIRAIGMDSRVYKVYSVTGFS